jgi:hypothetical protein
VCEREHVLGATGGALLVPLLPDLVEAEQADLIATWAGYESQVGCIHFLHAERAGIAFLAANNLPLLLLHFLLVLFRRPCNLRSLSSAMRALPVASICLSVASSSLLSMTLL